MTNDKATSPMVNAAIFDLDGTLFTGHIWQGLFRYLRLHRRNRLLLYAFLAAHMPVGFLCQMRLMDSGRMRIAWCRHMAWMLRGMSIAEGARAFTWITDEYVMPLLRLDVVALLREHQARGERVILLSGSFQPLLEIIGERLGADVMLGTQPEQRDGCYTGQTLEPVCQGEGKAVRLRAYLAEEGNDVDLGACSGYADSIFDLSVLEMVGHPVAVYPDEELASLAAQRGWLVFREGSPAHSERSQA
ncbi:MAG: HAD family hydrolase [Anaerolineae bacterium]|nr:HAD family hydrolase [Anaerolineae bacterium]